MSFSSIASMLSAAQESGQPLYAVIRDADCQENGYDAAASYRQIAALSKRFADTEFDAVYSSDRFRTMITALSVYKTHGLPLHTVPQLREVDVGYWEDMPWAEIEAADGEQLALFNTDAERWHVDGSERITEAVQYYYPVHHWSAWTAIKTDDGAVNMERTCTDCGKTETARIPDPCVGDEYCAGGVFDDMPAASSWMHEGIDYCVLFGLMNGVGKNQFDPMGQTTRAMLVSILYRMAGEPDVSELPEAPFVDVSDDA